MGGNFEGLSFEDRAFNSGIRVGKIIAKEIFENIKDNLSNEDKNFFLKVIEDFETYKVKEK